MPLDWRERMGNNGAVLEQSAIPPPYALLREVRLRKPWVAIGVNVEGSNVKVV